MNTNTLPVSATIIDIHSLNENTKMFSFDLSLGARAGQFINLWIPDNDEKPFSVADDDGKILKIAVARIGVFTHKLFEKKIGDRVGLRGPFGNTFSVSRGKRIALVGGGFGAAPLHFLGKECQKKGSSVSMFLGARSKTFLIYKKESEESGFATIVATNDGSTGERGLITLPLERMLAGKHFDLVQTCGPEKMMEAVARLCERYDTPCELSLERFMKCGFGVCGQCACNRILVCREGCIFSGKVALSFSDFGSFHRGEEGQKEFL